MEHIRGAALTVAQAIIGIVDIRQSKIDEVLERVRKDHPDAEVYRTEVGTWYWTLDGGSTYGYSLTARDALGEVRSA